MSGARVTAIIVSYNSRATLPGAIHSVREAHERGVLDCVVVDNSSTDESVSFLRTEHPWVVVVEASENLGFGRACNRGLEVAATPYVLLLNPDAELPVDALIGLLDFMDEHPRAGICGPAVREPSGSLQFAGGLPNPWRVLLMPLLPRWACRDRQVVVPGGAPFATDWICGSIMLLRRSMLARVGSFDPRFFLYFEETDLCRRARTAGWEIWAVGASVGQHVNAASAKQTTDRMVSDVIAEHYFQSRFYYLVKHYGWAAAATAELGEFACTGLRRLVDWVRRKPAEGRRGRLRSPELKCPPIRDAAHSREIEEATS